MNTINLGMFVLEISLCVVAILLIRSILGKFIGPKMCRWLWIVLIVRCLLPFSFELEVRRQMAHGSGKSQVVSAELPLTLATGFAPHGPEIDVPLEIPTSSNTAANVRDSNQLQRGASPAANARDSNQLQREASPAANARDSNQLQREASPAANVIDAGLPVFWGLGTLGFLLFVIHRNRSFARRVTQNSAEIPAALQILFRETARQVKLQRPPQLVVSRQVESPCVMGILRPKVLIPQKLIKTGYADSETMRHVLLHELVHLKQGDIWFSWCWTLVLAVHWYNPFLWWSCRKITQDCETACDAGVLERLPQPQRHSYGQSLLNILDRLSPAAFPVPGTSAIAEKTTNLERRLQMIKNYKKPALFQTLCGCLVLLVLCTVSMTTFAYRDADPNEPPVSADEQVEPVPNESGQNDFVQKPSAESSIESSQLEVAELLLELAKAEADNKIEVEYAHAVWTVAIAKAEANRTANAAIPNTIPAQQVLEEELQKTLAQKQYEKAVYDHNVLKPLRVELQERKRDHVKASAAAKRGAVERPEDAPEFHEVRVAEVLLDLAKKALEEAATELEIAKAAWMLALAEEERANKVNEQSPNTIPHREILDIKLRRTRTQAQYDAAKHFLEVVRPREMRLREQGLTIAWARLQQDSLPVNLPIPFQIVDDFLSSLAAKKYDKVLGMGDELFRSKLSHEQLQSIIGIIEEDLGAFQSREVISAERTEKFTMATNESLVYTAFLIRENRELGKADYRVIVNETNQVIGFFVVESEKK